MIVISIISIFMVFFLDIFVWFWDVELLKRVKASFTLGREEKSCYEGVSWAQQCSREPLLLERRGEFHGVWAPLKHCLDIMIWG